MKISIEELVGFLLVYLMRGWMGRRICFFFIFLYSKQNNTKYLRFLPVLRIRIDYMSVSVLIRPFPQSDWAILSIKNQIQHSPFYPICRFRRRDGTYMQISIQMKQFSDAVKKSTPLFFKIRFLDVWILFLDVQSICNVDSLDLFNWEFNGLIFVSLLFFFFL